FKTSSNDFLLPFVETGIGLETGGVSTLPDERDTVLSTYSLASIGVRLVLLGCAVFRDKG
ncbi:hypothetical protein ABTH47_19780, partial [Acinetobacter baumannii]